MMIPARVLLLLITVLSFSNTFSQVWHWGKKELVIEGIPTQPVISCIDSRGNTILLSLKLDRTIISKHDIDGNLLWKSECFLIKQYDNGLAQLCLDSTDNIYLAIDGISRVNAEPVTNAPSYSLVKLDVNGRFLWARPINYKPSIFAPRLVSSGNRIFLALDIPYYQTITYQSVTYDNLAGNTRSTWLAALDTAGIVQWSKRLYSPERPITCNVRDVFPQVSVNSNKELFLTGVATDKLFVESAAAIDLPLNCKHITYGMLMDGNNGAIKWAKELTLDTLTPRANQTTMIRRGLSTLLSNGNAVVYRFETRDTAIGTFNSRIREISNKIYLFDRNGNIIRKDSINATAAGLHEMLQLVAGDDSKFYSSGVNHQTLSQIDYDYVDYEARKWDAQFATNWKKKVEYSQIYPSFTSRHLYYREKQLSLTMQSGRGSANGNYAYFGADSLLPYLDNMYARMVDSASFISGTVFFDLNRNNIRDKDEPAAAGILLGSDTGSTVYASTRANGLYEIPANPGTYVIKPLNVAAAYPGYAMTPLTHSVSISAHGEYIRNKSFALQTNLPPTDGDINITPYGIARPGRLIVYKASIENIGTNDITGSYRIRFDTSRLVYVRSQHPGSHITLSTLSYSFGKVSSFDTITNDIFFIVKPSVSLDDTIKISAELTTVPADPLIENNVDSAIAVVRTSFDPNMKEVYPLKNIFYGDVTAGKLELDYRIHFQNTGNDTAFTIVLRDTLDNKLDLSTFRFVGSSHPVTVTSKGGNALAFDFPEILLPDSNTNEIKSHGFVRFTIKPKNNVQLTDVISNTASIYFDYNSAVVTNTVTTRFVNPVITSVSNIDPSTKGVLIQPNPTKGKVYFNVTTGNINEQMIINIYDEAGRLLMNTSMAIISNTIQTLDITSLSSGIYYLELRGKKIRLIQKLAVQ